MFLTENQADAIRTLYGTPVYGYTESLLRYSVNYIKYFPNAFGINIRYAMKANSNAFILYLFKYLCLNLESTSVYEVDRALSIGINTLNFTLSTQKCTNTKYIKPYINIGLKFNACSISQLECLGRTFPGVNCGIRINIGLGSGSTRKTSVGGQHASFGIWYIWSDEIDTIVNKYSLIIVSIHTHIGSGGDANLLCQSVNLIFNIVHKILTVKVLNVGGGYKVRRINKEIKTNFWSIGIPIREYLKHIALERVRKLDLEVEPGTYLVSNNSILLTSIQDKVKTVVYSFLKIDAGMTEILRPCLYASLHPIIILQKKNYKKNYYLVVGHCCESTDVLTISRQYTDILSKRKLNKAYIEDLCAIDGIGAYCSSMSTKNYNSFPEAPEVITSSDNSLNLIKKKQNVEQIRMNEYFHS